MQSSLKAPGRDANFRRGVIDFVIDDALNASRAVQRSTSRLRKAQKRLRARVDHRGWQAYLQVEERTNERAGADLRALFARMFEIYSHERAL